MKKRIYQLFILVLIFHVKPANAQSSSLIVTPSTQCFNSITTPTAWGYLSTGVPGATSYQWLASTTGCTAGVTTYSNGLIGYLTFPCCGIYTITVQGWNGSAFIAAVSTTANISCTGLSTAISPPSICAGYPSTITASGASSYTWSNGSVGASIVVSPTANTCYTVTGSNSSGCTANAVRCVSVTPSPVISVSGNTTVCAGTSTSLTASGASTYTWYTSVGTFTGSTIVLTPTATTCYSLIAMNSSSCTAYSGGCVTVSSSVNPVINSSNFNVCQGSSTYLYGTGAQSYTWFPGGIVSPTLLVTPSVTTCYTLVGYGCSLLGSSVRCVTVSTTPSISISGNSVVCPGATAYLSASGASSYTWITSQGTFNSFSISLTPTATSCYSLIASNGSGCTAYSIGCITVTPSSTINVSGNNNICSGNSTVLHASGASTYTWFPGGFTGDSIVVSPSVTTCYTVVSISSTGCSSSGVRCVSVSPGGTISISGPSSVCSGSYIVLNASGGTSYTWSPGGSHSSSIIVSPSVSTCYTLSGSNCSGVSSAVKCVSVNPSPTITVVGNTTVCAGSGASLTASGASTYTWYTGIGTFTGSSVVLTPSANTCYSLMGTNSSGCPGFAGACIMVQGSNLSVYGNTLLCAGSTATLFASGASSYTWSNGATTSTVAVSPTVTTCYTVTGSTSGCGNASGVICVSVSPQPVIYTASAFFCAGQTNTLMAFGAYTYTWLPFNMSGSAILITPTVSGCYTVTGTSTSGCTNSVAACYSVQPGSAITVSGNSVACYGQPTSFTASGASSYTWLPSNITGAVLSITPTTSGCYTVISNNSGGCMSSAVKCISVQTGPTITAVGSNSLCAGSSATLLANGASTYTWLPGNLSGAIVAVTPSVSTCYTVIGTNSSGCVGLNYVCVQVVPKPTIVTSSSFFCSGQSNILSATGANTYTWQPFSLTGASIAISPTVSGCYTVTGTNSYGCTNSATGCYSVLPAPVISVTGNSVACAGGTTSLVASGASSYTWYPGGSTGPVLVSTPSANVCYTVVGTNINGCIGVAYKCITVQYNQLYITGTNQLCAGSSANLLASGAATYTWNNGSHSPYITVSPSVSTCYTVSGTTSGGCIGYAVKCISVQAVPVITISGPGSTCSGNFVTLTASGASSYVWSNGSTNSSIGFYNNSTSVYSVTGSNGLCSSSAAYTMIAYPRPVIQIFRSDSIHHDSVICAGTPVHLYAVGAATYTWSTGSNSPYILVTPTATSTYSVVGSATNGCTDVDYITLYVSACTAIETLSIDNTSLQTGIYPNPTAGQLALQSNGTNKIHYVISDMLGRELLKGDFTGSTNLNLNSYQNGTYIIRFESGKATTYKKFVLEK